MRWAKLMVNNVGKVRKVVRPKGLIFHDIGMIYFPIPKVACTSIKNLLGQYAGLDVPVHQEDYLPPYDESIHVFQFPEIAQKALDAYDNYISFTVVRHPIQRMISCYRDKIINFHRMTGRIHFGLRRYNLIFGTQMFAHDMDFESFVRTINKIPDIISDEHFRSQYWFLPVSKGRINLRYVCKIEHLNEDLGAVFQSAGLSFKGLPQRNATKSKQMTVDVSEESLRLIRKRYAKDFRYLGYEP